MRIEYVPEFEDEYPRYIEGLATVPRKRPKKTGKKASRKAWDDITCHYCRETIRKGCDVYWQDQKWTCSLCHPTPRKATKVYPQGAFRARWRGTCAICQRPFRNGKMIIFAVRDEESDKPLYAHVRCKQAS